MFSSKTISFFFCLVTSVFATAQQPTIKILESGKKISIRGLSVVSDKIIWASGSGGNVARSTNGGNTFTWMKVPGYEKSDFRDIEAFDSNTAIIMGITTPAVILKTIDGGATWTKVFEDTTKGAFLDAMDFLDRKYGLVIGDPINNQLYQVQTSLFGDVWTKSLGGSYGPMNEGEAFFASSGTNVVNKGKFPHFDFAFVSGGKRSRLFIDRKAYDIPIMQGKESTGANSIAINNSGGVIVGGDFAKDTIGSNNCALFTVSYQRQLTFTIPVTPPHGYRSCVIYLTKKKLLTCGTSGIDISNDGGMNWELISKESFHVCQKAKKGKAVFLAGGGGRIAKLVYP